MLLIALVFVASTICLFLFSCLIYWWFRFVYFESYMKTIPGPTPLPLLGNALEFATSNVILSRLMKYYKKYGGNFKLWVGWYPVLFVSEPEDLEFVLNSNAILTKSLNYSFLHRWLGEGLLTSTGDRWRKHRKIITPAFHFKILEEFVQVFNSAGDVLVSKLDRRSGKGSFDVYPYITRCTLDIICETAMGTFVNAQEDTDSEYVKCVNFMLKVFIERTTSSVLFNDFLYRFSLTYQRERRALKVMHGYTKSVINKRKTTFINNDENKEKIEDGIGTKKKRAFLDLLLEYSFKDPSFTEEDIQQEVDTFMFEGHDTTSSAITFALYSLATNPDVQRKAYAEVQEIFSDDPKRQATYKDLQEMKYLEMVIKETVRIYTTVPVIGRVIEEDVDMNGKLLPKGLMIVIFGYGIHHNPQVFEDPERFIPDRFTAENTLGRHPFVFIPFSAGPRNCIGQKFAMLEMKATISRLLRVFELLPAVPKHDIILQPEGVLKSTNGVYIQLRRRETSINEGN